jgi:membrane protein YdbS with pleckstrin-like domain
MFLLVTCGKCGKHWQAPDSMKGRKVSCPSCGASLTVEGPYTVETEDRELVLREQASPPEYPPMDQSQSRIWAKVVGDGEGVRHAFSVSGRYRRARVLVYGVGGALFFVASALAGLVLFTSEEGRLGLPTYALLVSLAIFLPALFYYGFYLRVARAYALTNERVLVRKGWLSTNTVRVDYHKITDVAVSEDCFERLFATNTGTLSVNTAGGP